MIYSGNALKVLHEDRLREIQAANQRFSDYQPKREVKRRSLLSRLLRAR